ncbi:MAG TPA: enoyl-CoA hydratase/isomerase family protein [Acidimicrobiia bacterium]|jgi:enoyl-CoA hydratase/carnithine racemase|nr:enoyl-CoA hydratase/isomerase family protein [Acidimicrobiia bacterium]
MPDVLLVERMDAHTVLTLNRPDKRNALSVQLRDAISSALDASASDESVKCVVLTGSGTVFSSGFDLSEFTRAADDDTFGRELWASSDRFHDTVLRFPLPTIAAVNGPALAGGFDLAVMCDLRVAASTARFAHPERTFGDVVYGPLHDLVGGAIARDLTIGGREVDAAEALQLHLVNEVVEPDALMDATAALVERVCVAPRDVLMRTKAKALRRAGLGTESPTLDL